MSRLRFSLSGATAPRGCRRLAVGGAGGVKPSGRHCNGDDEWGRIIALSRNWLQRPFN
jgi:hypothetical protein